MWVVSRITVSFIYTASPKQRLNHFDTAYFSLFKEYFLKPCHQNRSTAVIIKIRGFINNWFINSKIYQTTSYRDRESKIIQTGKYLRQWVETTIKRCLSESRFSSEEKRVWSGWAGAPSAAFTCPVNRGDTQTGSHWNALSVIFWGGQNLNWTEGRRMMEVSFWNSHAIYAESEAEK